MKGSVMRKLTLLIGAALWLLAGCATTATKAEKGAGYGAAGGAAVGAVLGQVIGKNTESTVLGAAAGALVGAAAGGGIGHMMDKQEAEMREALAASEAAAVRREGDLLAITLKGDVTFDFDSVTVRPGLYNEINRIAEIMIKYPETHIMVEGHTDSVGSESYNQRLSERRAEAVKNLLVQRGVDAYRVTPVGYGESRPVATNAEEAGRQLNRRVEIRIKPIQAQG
jgi:outer membrane protein OmpA-like peptidoglycan-associated protein